MKRRDFFRTSLLASSGVLFIDSFLGCVHPAIQEGDLDQSPGLLSFGNTGAGQTYLVFPYSHINMVASV